MKKTLSLILSLVMLLSVMTAVPLAASAKESKTLSQVQAADKFANAYKAMDKLFKKCSSNYSGGKLITKGEYKCYRYRVKNKKLNSKKKVMKYLKKYFTESAAKRIFREHFAVKNGKLYVDVFPYGYDSALVINDIVINRIKKADGKYKVTYVLLWTGPDDSFKNTKSKQKYAYERGKWVLTYNGFWSGDYYGYDTVITPNDGQ